MVRPWYLLLLLAVLLIPDAVVSKKKHGHHKHGYDDLVSSVNVCDSQHQQILCCFCDSFSPGTAEDANCWVCNERPPGNAIWDSFSSQQNITHISFTVRPGSSLSIIPTRALSRLPKLTTVKVQYAIVAEVPSFALANASLLREATLARNQILSLRPSAFANLPMLSTLDLSENRLSSVPSDAFGPHLPELRRLFLDRNNISAVADGAFKHLTHLEELELNSNELTDIQKNTFLGLQSLKRIDLRSNRLVVLRDGTFLETPSLQELDMDENKLELVEPKAFEGLHRLMRLRLRDNKLKLLSDSTFVGVNNVHFLDLRDNDLLTLTATAVEPLRRNLKNVTMSFYLEGNNLVCDCRLAWMHDVHNETANERVRSSLEELKCRLHRDMAAAAAAAVGITLLPTEDTEEQGDDAGLRRDDYEEEGHSGGDVVIHLLQIPPEVLPCPEERRVLPLDVDEETLFTAEEEVSGVSGAVKEEAVIVLIAALSVARLVIS
ncbi:hypothetical protein J437_LFUL016447 [Ladona fulva]|uniref:Connectin n=1 Tax=Ladona fulva TaxID=123851 RepID=A0A8K0P552_LADFU|nr:hypothetical protein J437_LFUL016447 [Ladona fulva]